MSFRDEAEQEEHFYRNPHLARQALEEARKGPLKRLGVYWTAPHQEAPDPAKR